MNIFNKIISVFTFCALFLSCSSNTDTSTPVPIRDFATQYTTDNQNIIRFLKTHSITVVGNVVTDYPLVPLLDATSMWGGSDASHKTSISERIVTFEGNPYILYYLKLAQGGGDYPCNVDKVQINYSGSAMPDNPSAPIGSPFESNVQKPIFELAKVIAGWREIVPQFNAATSATSNDFGAGVMFIPSGFAYFNKATSNINSYTPLIFSFQLYNIYHLDQDGDGILSVNEDINNDHYATNDDTDGDTKPDCFDFDDDNDNTLTSFENKRPKVVINGVLSDNGSYPFNGALVDDPATPYIDETNGVPDCSGDFTSPNRIRRYLDSTCK